MREFACLAAVVALVGACGGSENADATATSVPVVETTSSAPSTTSASTTTSIMPEPTTQPTTPETTGMDSPPPANDELARIVEESIDDLASRLSVDASAISVVERRAVTWPDGSLGCPQLEGSHPEGEVEGYQVILQHESRMYIYHAAAGGDPFLCPSEDEKDGGHEFVPPPGFDD